MQLGRSYEKLNRLDSAIYYANVLVNFIKKYRSTAPDLADNTNTLVGLIAVKQKNYQKAIRYYKLASNNMGLAEVYQLLSQPDSVIYYSSIDLKTAEIQRNFNGIQAAAKLLAAAYKNSDPVKANAYLNIYAAAKDSLYNNAKLKQLEAIKLNEQKNEFELEKTQTAEKNKLVFISLFALLVLLILFLLMLWKNNRIKQQANADLESAYKNLKATQAQLVQAEKMASLGELTAGIAHEIQNPLNFVNNFSDVNTELIEELAEEAEKGNVDEVRAIAKDIRDNEEKINHHGKRADAIVKGMLQHSRANTGKKEPTDINALADEFLRLSIMG
jgi:C4-dicarboxylate-specific signal transduction histidine kinase